MDQQEAPSRWWGLLLVLPVIPLIGITRFVSGQYLLDHQLAGSPERWRIAAAGSVDLAMSLGSDGSDGAMITFSAPVFDDARSALFLDLVFISTFAVVAFVLLRWGHRYWAPVRRRGNRGIWRRLPYVALAGCALDAVETVAQLIWIDSTDPPTVVTHGVAVIAWWKIVAYAVTAVGLLGLVIGPALAPIVRPAMRRLIDLAAGAVGIPAVVPAPHRRVAADDEPRPDHLLGITASGGGIRSATVMLGAFRGLTRTGTFGSARWLHAVSGGGFAAGGWRVSSRRRGDTDLFEPDDAWFAHVRRRRRYLDNGVGSLVGGVVAAAVRTIAVLGSVVTAAMLIGWVVGRLTRSWALHPVFSNNEGTSLDLETLLAPRLFLPGLIPVVIAAVVFTISRTTSNVGIRAGLAPVVTVAALLGAVLLVVLVAVPVGIRYGRPVLSLLRNGSAELNAGLLGVFSTIGLIAAVRQLLTAELKKRWSRLGGVALGFGLLLLAGKVADDQANLERVFRGAWVPIVAVVWLVIVDLIPSHRLTLNGVYRKRLAETFAPGIEYADEPLWADYGDADGPELVLCGTAHSTKLQAGGLPALGFSFRPAGVTLHDGASSQWIGYPGGSSWQGFPRRWIITRSIALTGAAFASAMGRQSFGTTNSLLAAVNLRLGMWVPNPRRADWFVDPVRAPRVHLGYFAKEIFNRYDPQDDAFVYVADGGHRDNLGLVEQLRERPDEIIVLDASGDRPGGFGTMRQAIELADVELDVQIDLEWEPVTWRDHDVPIDCVTLGTATFRSDFGGHRTEDGHVTRIVYAKAQISDTAPSALRMFAAANPPFPDYSTGDQYLSETEFDQLVAMGEHLAMRIEAIRSAPVAPAGGPS